MKGLGIEGLGLTQLFAQTENAPTRKQTSDMGLIVKMPLLGGYMRHGLNS